MILRTIRDLIITAILCIAFGYLLAWILTETGNDHILRFLRDIF